jgi:PAS domain S-box-containing protein
MIHRNKWARYGLAITSAALAVGIRTSLNPVLQGRYVFGLAFCGVLATSWFGGRGPGILSVILESVATWYFIFPPAFGFSGKPDGTVFQAGVFAVVSSLIAILTGSLRKANDALQDREAYLRFMAAAMPEILFTADASGRIETLSERFLEFSGKRRPELGRLGWLDLLHEEDKEPTLKAWSASTGQQTEFRATCRLLEKSGGYRWFQCRAVPMLDKRQRVVRWFGVCADIDDHKLLQEALAKQSKALAMSNEDLQRFAFAASHDLQEPLRMIGVFSELLIRNQAQNKEASYLVAQITRGVQRMQELIQSTLDFSHIRSEDAEVMSEISLEQPLADALWGLQAAIDEAAAKIETEHPLPEVRGNSQMISRVFQNLVQNAMKFRGEEPVEVRIASRRDGETCVVSVTDNGIGMSMEYAESVFEPFRRLHPRGGYPGSGLGLASVKKIVELHQGRVWVESKAGQGCTFFFTLPLARTGKDLPPSLPAVKDCVADRD